MPPGGDGVPPAWTSSTVAVHVVVSPNVNRCGTQVTWVAVVRWGFGFTWRVKPSGSADDAWIRSVAYAASIRGVPAEAGV